MPQSFDPTILNPIITGFIDELISAKGALPPTKPVEIATKPVNEYEGRMVVKANDKFDVPVYIAASNFYLNQGEMQGHRARGTVIIYMDIEVADKLFKAAGLQVPYDEDDESMTALCGNLCQVIADAIKNGLAAAGFANLLVSEPSVSKNTISEGVEFSRDQKEKQEISFNYLRHKALVIDWTMAPLPRK